MITELKPTNLIAVEVPEDSSNARVCVSHKYYHVLYDLPNHNAGQVDFLYQVKILGEVTKDKIGFDVTPFLRKIIHTNEPVYYKLYNNEGAIATTDEHKSFYSLLAANGLYFENPVKVSGKHVVGTINRLAQEWQSFEDKLIAGKLLITRKTLK